MGGGVPESEERVGVDTDPRPPQVSPACGEFPTGGWRGGGSGGFDRAIRVTTAEHSLVARLTQPLPSIFCGFSDADRPPVSGSESWELAQGCPRAGGDRKVGRIRAVV